MARLGNLDYEGAKAADLIPPGTYEAKIIKSDVVPTKNGEGKMLVLDFEISVGGRRRIHWERLNLVNNNADAVRIATRSLMQIAEAVGVPLPVVDSEDLHHKPMMVTVGIDAGKNGFQDKNKLTKFAPWQAGTKAAPSAAGSAKAPAGGDVPW